MPLRSKVTVFKDEDSSRCKGRIIVINDGENPFEGRRTSSSRTEKKPLCKGEYLRQRRRKKSLCKGRLPSAMRCKNSSVQRGDYRHQGRRKPPEGRTKKIPCAKGDYRLPGRGKISLYKGRLTSSRTEKIPSKERGDRHQGRIKFPVHREIDNSMPRPRTRQQFRYSWPIWWEKSHILLGMVPTSVSRVVLPPNQAWVNSSVSRVVPSQQFGRVLTSISRAVLILYHPSRPLPRNEREPLPVQHPASG